MTQLGCLLIAGWHHGQRYFHLPGGISVFILSGTRKHRAQTTGSHAIIHRCVTRITSPCAFSSHTSSRYLATSLPRYLLEVRILCNLELTGLRRASSYVCSVCIPSPSTTNTVAAVTNYVKTRIA